jgi:endonuclease IV
LLGEGKIGSQAFGWLLRDPRTSDVPLILETPQKNYDIADDDPSPDPYDVAMVQLLASMM